MTKSVLMLWRKYLLHATTCSAFRSARKIKPRTASTKKNSTLHPPPQVASSGRQRSPTHHVACTEVFHRWCPHLFADFDDRRGRDDGLHVAHVDAFELHHHGGKSGRDSSWKSANERQRKTRERQERNREKAVNKSWHFVANVVEPWRKTKTPSNIAEKPIRDASR